MPLLSREDGTLKVGGLISPLLENKLKSAPSSADIWENMEELNSEVVESHGNLVIATPEEDLREHEKTVIEAEERKNPTSKKIEKRDLKPLVKKEERKVQEKPKLEIRQRKEVVMKEKDLEKELDALVEKHTESSIDEEQSQKERIMKALRALPDAPSDRQIAAWKAEHGQDGIHITPFSEKEIYIYTHLTRGMFAKVQEKMQQMQANKSNVGEEELKETIVKYCIKWPALTVEWKINSRAGIVDALYQSIMQNSYFLTPQQVMAITCEL